MSNVGVYGFGEDPGATYGWGTLLQAITPVVIRTFQVTALSQASFQATVTTSKALGVAVASVATIPVQVATGAQRTVTVKTENSKAVRD